MNLVELRKQMENNKEKRNIEIDIRKSKQTLFSGAIASNYGRNNQIVASSQVNNTNDKRARQNEYKEALDMQN